MKKATKVKKKKENDQMSVEAGLPDVENFSDENNLNEESVEIEDSLNSPGQKERKIKSLKDKKYKTYTEEFDEIIAAEDLESEEELTRLRQNLRSTIIRV